MRGCVREHVKERSAPSATAEMYAEALLAEHPAWGVGVVVVAVEHPTAAVAAAITGRLLYT